MNARRLILATLATLSTVAGGLLFSGAAAQAAFTHNFVGSFGVAGPGSGAFSTLASVAVDQSTGDVYVYATEYVEAREADVPFIYKFNAAGAPVDFSALGTNVIEGSGQAASGQVAVDSSSGPAKGDIYVTEDGNGQYVAIYGSDGEKLGELGEGGACGVAVDPAGNVYIANFITSGSGGIYGSVSKYDAPAVNPVTEGDYSSSLAGLPVGSCKLAADSEGNVYVGSQGNESNKGVRKYEALQFGLLEASGTVIDEHAGAVAVDPASSSDALYGDEGFDVAQYDSSGGLLGKFGASGAGALSGGSDGIAVNHLSGEVYVADPEEEGGKGVVNIYGPDVVVPDASVEAVSNLQARSVTLNGTVNPDDAGNATCEFEYGTSTSYGKRAECAGPGSKGTPIPGGPGANSPVPVHSVEVKGLLPDTTYHFRLDASNANGTNTSQDGEFKTSGPGIDGESVSDVASTSADLQAQIAPNDADTTYHFEYGIQEGVYGQSAPVPDGSIVAGVAEQGVSVYVQELVAGTTYHYRVVASNASVTVDGPEQVFTTQAGGGELALPDGRAWELVSPPVNDGAKIEPAPILSGGVTQASKDGGAITYLARAPLGGDQVGNEGPDNTQVFSERGPGGWSSQDIQSPSERPAGPSLGGGGEYRFFSSDLSLGLLRPVSSTALSPEVPAVNTIYLHDNPGGGYLPLLTAANVEVPGAKVGFTPGDVSEIGLETDPLFMGSTPDLSDVVFTDDEALTTNAVKSTNGNVNVNLYEWAAGKLQLVNVLPDGLPTTDAGGVVPALGFEDKDVRHAISNDGSRIVWSNGVNGSAYGQHLYMRDTATRETIQLDVAHGVPEPSEGGAVFQTASSNGSKVFFTDLQKLTAGSTAIGGQQGPVDLYEFEVTSGSGEPLAGRLTDLTVDQHAGEMAGVLGLLPGASEDGSNVYFVANGVLAPGAAPGNCLRSFPSGGEEPRTCNLYLLHDSAAGWTTTFIATLSNEDAPDWGRDLSEYGELRVDTSRVSPSGRYLAFMSERSLTGYDNHDANSGMPDEEVFLYDASTNHLVCASCDPTGARPVGMLDKGRNDKEEGESLIDDVEAFRGHWLAGNVPGWMYDGGGDALYQSRYLSDSGRLFFNSPDALVPQDTNGKENVYEYEPPASEETPASDSCTLASPTYSPSSGGCVALISSGTSAEESAFLDASESGDDVFFLTTSRLVPQDRDTSFNVYDAHVCSAAAPCATTPVLPPPCTTTDSCEPAPSPQPGIFGASGSATFSGAGNLVPATSKPATKSKSKSLTRAQKLSKSLKACRKKPKNKRASCKARARKRYGAKPNAKKSDGHNKRGSK